MLYTAHGTLGEGSFPHGRNVLYSLSLRKKLTIQYSMRNFELKQNQWLGEIGGYLNDFKYLITKIDIVNQFESDMD